MSVDAVVKGMSYDSTPVETDLKVLLGGMVNADWRQALIARGFGWNVTVGTGVTPIQGGGAGTVFDLDQPEFGISIPSGYTCIPYEFHIQALPGLQTTDSHVTDIIVAADLTAAYAGDGTVTTETPRNLRTNTSGNCPLTCFSAATADITDPVLTFDLARRSILTDVQGTAATVNLNQLALDYEPRNPPFIVGPAAIYGYWCGSIATNGYAQLNFIAIPSTLVSALA